MQAQIAPFELLQWCIYFTGSSSYLLQVYSVYRSRFLLTFSLSHWSVVQACVLTFSLSQVYSVQALPITLTLSLIYYTGLRSYVLVYSVQVCVLTLTLHSLIYYTGLYYSLRLDSTMYCTGLGSHVHPLFPDLWRTCWTSLMFDLFPTQITLPGALYRVRNNWCGMYLTTTIYCMQE